MRGFLLLLCFSSALAGCVESNAVQCANGRTCPPNASCDEVHGTCVRAEQLEVCVGVADGTDCEIDGKSFGECRDQVCVAPGCGNGIVEGSEQCDGTVPEGKETCQGNGFHDDGTVTCNSDCTLDVRECTEFCGDGVINGNEACDVGKLDNPDDDALGSQDCTSVGYYNASGLKCSAACTLDVQGCTGRCGDGMLDSAHEECDGAMLGQYTQCNQIGYYDTDALGCTKACKYDQSNCDGYCGDGIKNAGELCDPGTTGVADLASEDCTNFGYYATSGLKCSAACTFDTSTCTGGYCGDGILQSFESCDDHRTASTADDVFGGADCTTLGYYSAAGLACNPACGFDTSSCTGFCGDRDYDSSHEVCEGTSQPGRSCLDYGYESGALDCAVSCGPSFGSCHRAQWTSTRIPTTPDLLDVWASSPQDMFAVGMNGVIRHFDGVSWTAMTSPTTENLYAVWGSGPSNVLAVGEAGTIVRYNGTSWSTMTSGVPATTVLTGVWTDRSSNAYAVGYIPGPSVTGVILQWNGISWTADPSAPASDFQGVWGAGSTVIAVAASGGGIYHIGGPQPPLPSGSNGLKSVWGTAPDNAYAVGANGGRVLHYDGSSWSVMGTSFTSSTIEEIWGSSPSDLWVVSGAGLFHFDGTAWTGTTLGGNAVFGTSAADIVTVGNSGVVNRYDGEAWRALPNPDAANNELHAVWGSSASSVYAGGSSGTFLHYDGFRWLRGSLPSFLAALNGMWGFSDVDVYAVGNAGTIRRFQGGNAWTDMVSGVAVNLNGVWGPTNANVYAVGDAGTIVHYDGNINRTWTTMSSGVSINLRAIWGTSANDIYAGGDNTLLHFNGSTWSTVLTSGPSGDSGIQAIWGSGPKDIFVVGGNGIAQHWNGASWSALSSLPATKWYAVNGTGPSDVYLASEAGAVYHFDGLQWSPMQTPSTGLALYGVTAVGGQLFSVGVNGVTLGRARRCFATELDCGDGLDDDCDGYVDCGDPQCAGNNRCMNGGVCARAGAPFALPRTIACGGTISDERTTDSGVNALDRYSCSSLEELGPERTYAFTPATNVTVTATLGNMTGDLDLFVLGKGAGGGCEPRATGCLGASAHKPSEGPTETVQFTALANQTYYLVVDSYGSSTGGFSLGVTCQ